MSPLFSSSTSTAPDATSAGLDAPRRRVRPRLRRTSFHLHGFDAGHGLAFLTTSLAPPAPNTVPAATNARIRACAASTAGRARPRRTSPPRRARSACGRPATGDAAADVETVVQPARALGAEIDSGASRRDRHARAGAGFDAQRTLSRVAFEDQVKAGHAGGRAAPTAAPQPGTRVRCLVPGVAQRSPPARSSVAPPCACARCRLGGRPGRAGSVVGQAQRRAILERGHQPRMASLRSRRGRSLPPSGRSRATAPPGDTESMRMPAARLPQRAASATAPVCGAKAYMGPRRRAAPRWRGR